MRSHRWRAVEIEEEGTFLAQPDRLCSRNKPRAVSRRLLLQQRVTTVESAIAILDESGSVEIVRTGARQNFDASEPRAVELRRKGLELMRISRIELLGGSWPPLNPPRRMAPLDRRGPAKASRSDCRSSGSSGSCSRSPSFNTMAPTLADASVESCVFDCSSPAPAGSRGDLERDIQTVYLACGNIHVRLREVTNRRIGADGIGPAGTLFRVYRPWPSLFCRARDAIARRGHRRIGNDSR